MLDVICEIMDDDHLSNVAEVIVSMVQVVCGDAVGHVERTLRYALTAQWLDVWSSTSVC